MDDKRKTLVLNYGTKYAEYYGWVSEIGWCTAASPIHHFTEDATWEDIKKNFPDEHFNGVDLVMIEIKTLEADEKPN